MSAVVPIWDDWLRSARSAARRAWKWAGDYPRRCSRGHGGHQIDALYCRICGERLTTEGR